jgi:hypothetical protein
MELGQKFRLIFIILLTNFINFFNSTFLVDRLQSLLAKALTFPISIIILEPFPFPIFNPNFPYNTFSFPQASKPFSTTCNNNAQP